MAAHPAAHQINPPQAHVPVVHIVSVSPVYETLAVMRIDDHGGTVELALGQTPLLSDDLPYW